MTRTGGRFTTRGEPALVTAALREFEPIGPLDSARSTGRFLELDGRPAYLKYSSLRGKHSLRHALRSLRPGALVPRLQEFENLGWLRAQGFGAPEPLAAGVCKQRGLPVFQFLATERVGDTRTLRDELESEADPGCDRSGLLERLGEDVARMHSLGFVHRDLFPRNILVPRSPGETSLHYLDAWRAGPGRSLRGGMYDLACLMLYATELLEPEEQGHLLESYFATRARLGTNLDRRSSLAAIRRQRTRLVQQLIRRGRDRPPIPRLAWEPPDPAGWTP